MATWRALYPICQVLISLDERGCQTPPLAGGCQKFGHCLPATATISRGDADMKRRQHRQHYDGQFPQDDSNLMPTVEASGVQGPVDLSVRLMFLAGALSFLMVWAVLSILFVYQQWEFIFWPFCAGPLIVWVVFVLAPMWWHFTSAARALPRAIARTAQAWEARAEYVQILNRHNVGHVYPVPTDQKQLPPGQVVEHREPRAVPLTSQGGKEMIMVDQAQAIPNLRDAAPSNPPGGPVQNDASVPGCRIWHVKIPDPDAPPGSISMKDVPLLEQQVRRFLEGIYRTGWTRNVWVPRPFSRPEYEALMKLVTEMNIIIGRGQGTPGKLALPNATEALLLFGMVP